ncbi:homoprotocatechuate degradation operon regulator HpaR [Pseudomonas psychrotolerans L19]|nr:homoprotocatechuate degradation operon regulator HpaR [Pseudomonas psychrotolerans L19]
MHELANQACILKPSMSGVLVRMEQTGYVTRYRNARDARRVHVKLTDQGEACFAAMAGGMEANYQRILKQFGEEKLGTLIGLLEELKRIEPEDEVAPASGSEQDA